MREPAAHALCILLNSLYDAADSDSALPVAQAVVESVIVPQLLLVDHDVNNDNSNADAQRLELLSKFSAEQLAVAIHIQSHATQELPFPLDEPVLTKTTLPHLAPALCATSAVTQPRTHLVWDVLWEYLTENSSDNVTLQPAVILGPLLQTVVIQGLLDKTTHERRALALCVLRNLVDIEFVSSLAGRRESAFGTQFGGNGRVGSPRTAHADNF